MTINFSYYQNKYTYWSKRGVKGPKAYPILGTYLAENLWPSDETEFKFFNEYGPYYGTFYNTKPVSIFALPESLALYVHMNRVT